MKKAVIIPDSFKGSLSSQQICDIIKEKVAVHFPDCETVAIPVADGGEGSADSFISALGGEKKYVTVKNPFFEDITTYYALLDRGKTAVIELACAAGLTLAEGRKNPLITTTYGFGQLLSDAAMHGCKKIIACLGGSCTNDGGTGAAAACGAVFTDKNGRQFIPTGRTLCDIADINLSALKNQFDGIQIVTMCDIDNPLCGKNGASYVFAPQKGAESADLPLLDDGLRHVGTLLSDKLGRNVLSLVGGGAAGGAGAGMSAFFGSLLMSGIDTLLDAVEFEKVIKDADVVFTGEGKLDSQSLGGKAVIGIARRAKKMNVPVIAIVGGAEYDLTEVYDEGVTAVFTVSRLAEDFSVSKFKAKENLAETIDNMLRLMRL